MCVVPKQKNNTEMVVGLTSRRCLCSRDYVSNEDDDDGLDDEAFVVPCRLVRLVRGDLRRFRLFLRTDKQCQRVVSLLHGKNCMFGIMDCAWLGVREMCLLHISTNGYARDFWVESGFIVEGASDEKSISSSISGDISPN